MFNQTFEDLQWQLNQCNTTLGEVLGNQSYNLCTKPDPRLDKPSIKASGATNNLMHGKTRTNLNTRLGGVKQSELASASISLPALTLNSNLCLLRRKSNLSKTAALKTCASFQTYDFKKTLLRAAFKKSLGFFHTNQAVLFEKNRIVNKSEKFYLQSKSMIFQGVNLPVNNSNPGLKIGIALATNVAHSSEVTTHQEQDFTSGDLDLLQSLSPVYNRALFAKQNQNLPVLRTHSLQNKVAPLTCKIRCQALRENHPAYTPSVNSNWNSLQVETSAGFSNQNTLGLPNQPLQPLHESSGKVQLDFDFDSDSKSSAFSDQTAIKSFGRHHVEESLGNYFPNQQQSFGLEITPESAYSSGFKRNKTHLVGQEILTNAVKNPDAKSHGRLAKTNSHVLRSKQVMHGRSNGHQNQFDLNSGRSQAMISHQMQSKFASDVTLTCAAWTCEHLANQMRHSSLKSVWSNFSHQVNNLMAKPNCAIAGLRVSACGRLTKTKKPMAQNITMCLGRVPLSSLKARIDFAQTVVVTPLGALGLKVWLTENPDL